MVAIELNCNKVTPVSHADSYNLLANPLGLQLKQPRLSLSL